MDWWSHSWRRWKAKLICGNLLFSSSSKRNRFHIFFVTAALRPTPLHRFDPENWLEFSEREIFSRAGKSALIKWKRELCVEPPWHLSSHQFSACNSQLKLCQKIGTEQVNNVMQSMPASQLYRAFIVVQHYSSMLLCVHGDWNWVNGKHSDAKVIFIIFHFRCLSGSATMVCWQLSRVVALFYHEDSTFFC